jgi:DNA-binding NtrC family response regulator
MKKLKRVSVLLVEDESDLRRETAAFLELYCGRVIAAANGREALDLFIALKPDLVVTDIRMPVMDGLELAARLKEISTLTPVVVHTAFSETSYLLKAIELGVAGFVKKPTDADELLATLARVAIPIMQRLDIEALADEQDASVMAWMGAGPALKALAAEVNRVARTPFNVLLQGETGSGKSHLAGIIHSLSSRCDRPFVSINLGAMPEQLAESELFGYVRGAFTGATANRTGLVETARGGAIFLDDVDACPPVIQAKLLRFVEEKRFTPLGSSTERTGDVRIISASNKDLKEAVRSGRFREDLYYRLADFVIHLPSLRQAPEMIVPLAVRFLQETCEELGRDIPLLDDGARRLLAEGRWTGNIRQLKSVVRRAALACGDVLAASDIASAMGERESAPPHAAENGFSVLPPPFPCSMDALEKWSLEQALLFCEGKRMKTAAMLGLNYYTFRRRLEKHAIVIDT